MAVFLYLFGCISSNELSNKFRFFENLWDICGFITDILQNNLQNQEKDDILFTPYFPGK